ncbi:MAG: nucleoside 2-deoxyribosyltransferase [Planctomycetaceae bacterium]|nr:nucleoside 2-deoxyribosyltransferase [Planctomycetaceae bacterium]
MDALRVYCAGPLFNSAERNEMTAIADALVATGFSVYLPHRDGMEFRLVLEVLVDRGWERAVAAQFLHEAIFALDVYQVIVSCDALVWNLNGRTPDEGAVSEAAIAWTLGKPIVAYQDDVRSLIAGRVNPLLVGLVDFERVDEIDAIVPALQETLTRQRPLKISVADLPPKLQRACRDGAALWEAMAQEQAYCENEILADCVTDLFAPSSHHPGLHQPFRGTHTGAEARTSNHETRKKS